MNTFLFKEFGVRTTTDERMTKYEMIVDVGFSDLPKPSFQVEPFRSALRTEHNDTRVIPILRFRYVYNIPGITKQTLRETFPLAAIEYGAGFLLLVSMILKESDKEPFALLDYVIKSIQVVLKKLEKAGTLE